MLTLVGEEHLIAEFKNESIYPRKRVSFKLSISYKLIKASSEITKGRCLYIISSSKCHVETITHLQTPLLMFFF